MLARPSFPFSFQRNDFSTDHYEDFSASTTALKRVVWPATAGSVGAAEETEGRQRHRSSSQQRARAPSGAVDRPMEWIGQQQRESAERVEREYEMEIQKKAWDAHHSESYYRMSRSVPWSTESKDITIYELDSP